MSDQETVFSKLTISESYSKLQFAKQVKLKVTAWANLNKLISCNIEEIEKNEESISIVFSSKLQNIKNGSKLNFYFTQDPIDFFFCGIKIDNTTFELADLLIRSEKRKNDRIFAFPHRNIFFCIKIKIASESENIVFFNKTDRKAKKIFTKYLEDRSDKKSNIKKFRVLDISKNGISFLASEKESEILQNLKTHKAQIHIDNTVIDIEKFEMKNIVNYIDSRCKNITMFKVGVLFSQENEDLSDLIDGYTSKILSITSLNEEYLKFIKQKYE